MKLNKLLASLVLAGIMSTNAMAQENLSITILTPSQIKQVIGEAPAVGSKEEAGDYKALLDWQDKRTVEQCEFAAAQDSANLKTLFVANNGPLSEKEGKTMEILLFKKYAEAGLNIYLAKKQYNRPRPYDANPEVKPCIPLETSSAYPSGHAAIAQFFANELSDYYPERRAAFMKRAKESSMNRVIGGVHHPSDVVAGVKLGDVLYKLLKEK